MAIFYRPPEPVQAVPKVLPRTPGSEPPRNGPLGGSSGILTAISAWATAAAVPMPTQRPLNIVPLTLTYGQQPPRSGQLTGANDTAEMAVILASYPQPGEPRLLPLKPLNVVPLTLKYGAQPPPSTGLPAPTLALITQQYPSVSWPAQSAPISTAWVIPPIVSAHIPPALQPAAILQAWYNDPIVIVWVGGGAGLPVAGDQPPVQGPLRPTELSILRAWDPPSWPTQSEPENAGWNVTPPVVNNPPPFTPYPFASLLQWGTTWPAQSEGDNAGWNFVPPVVNVPPPRAVAPIGAVFAWQPPPPLPVRPVGIVPLTLRYGTQPPPSGPINPVTLSAILQQWPAVWWPAQAPDPVAPLTLVYGDRPPILGVRVPLAALLGWYPAWAAQFAGPSAAIAAPLIVIPVILIGTLHLEAVFTAVLSVDAALEATLAIQPPPE